MTLSATAPRHRETPLHPRSRCFGVALGGFLALAPAALVSAEELTTSVMQQGGSENAVDMPDHGQSQAVVEKRYGQPQTVSGPVGEPPITQWHYADFVVYFEYDHVIHAVAKPKR